MENIKSRRWCDSEPFICFHPTCWLEQQSNCYRLTAVALIIGLLEVTRLNYCTLEFRIQDIPGRGAIGGKTGKTMVLPGFCKIECDGGSGGAQPC